MKPSYTSAIKCTFGKISISQIICSVKPVKLSSVVVQLHQLCDFATILYPCGLLCTLEFRVCQIHPSSLIYFFIRHWPVYGPKLCLGATTKWGLFLMQPMSLLYSSDALFIILFCLNKDFAPLCLSLLNI